MQSTDCKQIVPYIFLDALEGEAQSRLKACVIAAMKILTDNDIERKLVKEFDKIRIAEILYCSEYFNLIFTPYDDGFTISHENEGRVEKLNKKYQVLR